MLLHGRLYLFDFRAHIVQRQECQRLPFCHLIARLDENLFDQKTFRDGQRSSNSGGYLTGNRKALRNYTLVRGGHRDDWKRGGRGSAHQQSQQKHERKKAQHGNTGMPLVGFGSGSSVQPLSEFMYHVQRVHPFTAPFVKPASRYVCPKRKTRIEGSNIHRLAAIARPSCFVSRLAGSVKKRDSGQYCGDSKKVIGCSMAFQASKNPSVRADIRPGIPNGIPMRQKTLPLICTVDRSGLQDFSRNRVKAALHDKYRKCRKDAR